MSGSINAKKNVTPDQTARETICFSYHIHVGSDRGRYIRAVLHLAEPIHHSRAPAVAGVVGAISPPFRLIIKTCSFICASRRRS